MTRNSSFTSSPVGSSISYANQRRRRDLRRRRHLVTLSLFQQPSLLIDQPRGANGVFDLPVLLSGMVDNSVSAL
jgi:hypothetical protein